MVSIETTDGGSNCPKCGAPTNIQVRNCESCNYDLGFPNVRLAKSQAEQEALNNRFEGALEEAQRKSVESEFTSFVSKVNQRSGVVVSAPAITALNLIQDPRFLYQNYEKLVESGSRSPAEIENDKQRRVAVGAVFGSYGNELRYGVLSLNSQGLPTYGDVFLRLGDRQVKDRVAFLEMNSYKFANKFPEANKPAGYLADWNNRGQLAGVKVIRNFRNGLNSTQQEQLILQSDGKRRENDEYIEALIYGTFNRYSIESVVLAPSLTGETKTLAKLALDRFNNSNKFEAEK